MTQAKEASSADEPNVYHQPPLILSFLAPAKRCNQRCPKCYLTEVVHEPVTDFVLSPEDYARFVHQVQDEGVPIAGVMFQGFEVTLPESWPYVEAVFGAAPSTVRRSFITNGMLLHKWAGRIAALGPDRVSVSLDGGTAAENDRVRGLPGSFLATVRSMERFVDTLPWFCERLGVVSCVYDDDNARSLVAMPALLRTLGIRRWALGFELGLDGGLARPVQSRETIERWLQPLLEAAEAADVYCYVNDELRFFDDGEHIRARSLFDPEFLVRFDTLGHVRSGTQIAELWSGANSRRWDPRCDRAIDVIGYHDKYARWLAAESLPRRSEAERRLRF